MKFLHKAQCLPNKHIYFINGSFTSFLVHLFLELGIDLFKCKNSHPSTSFRGVILNTGESIGKILTLYFGLIAALFLFPDFWDKKQPAVLPNEPLQREDDGSEQQRQPELSQATLSQE